MIGRFLNSGRPAKGRALGWRACLLALVAALPIAVFVLVAWYDYDAEVRAVRQSALTNAYTLAEHADAVFSAVDIALLQLDAAVEDRTIGEVRTDGRVHQMLQDVLRRLPPLESVFLVDESGNVAASSRAFPMPPYDVRQREYFVAAKEGHEGLFFSAPFRGQFARSVAFTVSRPIVRDGVFQGIAAVTVFPEYFHSLYRGASLHENNATAALVRKDGTVIFRSPNSRPITDLASAAPEFVVQAAGQSSGLIVGKGALDPKPGLTAYRALPTVPLTLVYAVNDSDMLGAWYRRLVGYGIAAACASAAFATGGVFLLFGAARPPGSAGDEDPAPSEDEPQRPREATSRVERGVDTVLTVVLTVLALVRRQLQDGAGEKGGPPPGAEVNLQDAVDGAAHGVATAQRFIANARSKGTDARIVNVKASLGALRKLLMGSIWPPLEFTEEAVEHSTDILVDPARFDLALLDLALGLKDCAPAGVRLSVQAVRRVVRNAERDDLAPGDYVAIDFVLDSDDTLPRDFGIRGETRLRLVARFASESDGLLVLDDKAGLPIRATLWLPAALIRRDPSKM